MERANQESADLNIRGMDPAVVEQVRIAAARRGGRAALRSWVTQALLRVLRLENDPRPQPRLFLCAACVAKNLERNKLPILGLAGSGTRPRPRPEGEEHCLDPAVSSSPLVARLLQKIEAPAAEAAASEAGPPAAAAFPTDTSGALPESPAPQQPSLAAIETAAIEVAPGLLVGSDTDYAVLGGRERWSYLQAAKEPWHRTMVGYQTKSSPESPERLVARRGNVMALNLIDVRKLGPGGETYTPAEVIRAGLSFMAERLYAGDQVLVHSNHGHSRAPGLALLYLQQSGALPGEYEAAADRFRQLYPAFAPNPGIETYLRGRGADFSGKQTAHATLKRDAARIEANTE